MRCVLRLRQGYAPIGPARYHAMPILRDAKECAGPQRVYLRAARAERPMSARRFFADYLECAKAAREYADAMRLPVVIRNVTEYGRKGFLFHLKSADGSDYMAETVMPGNPR